MGADKRLKASIGAGVAIAAVAGFVGVKALTPKPQPALPTAVARIADVEDSVLATGSLQPVSVVDVGSEVSGRVIELKVKISDLVRKGQTIAVIDPTRLQNELRQQENNIRQAESNLRDRLAQLELSRLNADRQKQLFERGATSRVQYEQAQANYQSRLAQTDNQRQQIDNQKIVLDQRRAELEKATIRAPIDGIVAEVVTHEGDVINVFRDAPVIVKLARTDVMTVRTQVSEADIRKVRPGQKAYFTILGEPNKRRYATVKSREIAPAGISLNPEVKATPGAVYYNVIFEAPNEDEVLMPAMTAQVHVVVEEANNVVAVPVAALTGREGEQTVRVVEKDGDIVEREVEVGVTNNFLAEIRDGLEAGDRVLVAQGETAATAEP
jgi:macrolide-specific efflux system membrane fusion protein